MRAEVTRVVRELPLVGLRRHERAPLRRRAGRRHPHVRRDEGVAVVLGGADVSSLRGVRDDAEGQHRVEHDAGTGHVRGVGMAAEIDDLRSVQLACADRLQHEVEVVRQRLRPGCRVVERGAGVRDADDGEAERSHVARVGIARVRLEIGKQSVPRAGTAWRPWRDRDRCSCAAAPCR